MIDEESKKPPSNNVAINACAKYSLIKLLLFIGVNWM